MSYDLMVFEKTKAPNNKKDFIKWTKRLSVSDTGNRNLSEAIG